MQPLRPETASAVEAVRAVLPILLARRGADDVRFKGPGDVVTASDLQVESTLQRMLAERHPDVPFVGEEGGQLVPTDGRFWLVDPLCGTANYAAGVPMYAVNVALVEDDQVTLSLVADGATGDVFVAECGRGAWALAGAEPRRLRASATNGLVAVDPFLGQPGPLSEFGRAFARRAMNGPGLRVRLFASMLVLAYVASGRLAGAVFGSAASPVHVAAGLLLAHEAGATITDAYGQPWSFRGPAFVIGASEELHANLRELARATIETFESLGQ
jgi:myo-inositol-1(or 4)-monophosphatase